MGKLENNYKKDIRKYTLEDLKEGNLQEVKYRSTDEIGAGEGGNNFLYLLGDENLIRIPKIQDIFFGLILEDYENHLIALEKKVLTPEIFGIYNSFQKYTKKKFPGIIIKYLDGLIIERIEDKKTKEKASNLCKKEMEKVKDLGFYFTRGEERRNAIWVPKKEKVYLIDWEAKKYVGKDREKILEKIFERHKIN